MGLFLEGFDDFVVFLVFSSLIIDLLFEIWMGFVFGEVCVVDLMVVMWQNVFGVVVFENFVVVWQVYCFVMCYIEEEFGCGLLWWVIVWFYDVQDCLIGCLLDVVIVVLGCVVVFVVCGMYVISVEIEDGCVKNFWWIMLMDYFLVFGGVLDQFLVNLLC